MSALGTYGKSIKKIKEDARRLRERAESGGASDLFGLADGEHAKVRFLKDPTKSFFLDRHPNIRVSKGFRSFNCIGEENGCEFCLRGIKKTERIVLYLYVHEHTKKENNKDVKIEVKEFKLMELSMFLVAETLTEYMEDYGTLTDRLWKIKRVGAGLDTKYIFTPLKEKAMTKAEKDVEQVDPGEIYLPPKDADVADALACLDEETEEF